MFVQRAFVPESARPEDSGVWPYTVPCVAQLLDDGMAFHKPITMVVGENGSGKSTLVEAIAEGFRLDAQGGRASNLRGRPNPTKTALGEVLKLETTARGSEMLGGPRLGRKGFFLRAETAFGMTENLGGRRGFWEEDTSRMSHGESYLTVFRTMMRDPGFYVLDEPESGLSFQSTLVLMAQLYELGKSGAQVVCATHSPLLASTPGAGIIEIGEHGFRGSTWRELDVVTNWSRFLDQPDFYLRHITQP